MLEQEIFNSGWAGVVGYRGQGSRGHGSRGMGVTDIRCGYWNVEINFEEVAVRCVCVAVWTDNVGSCVGAFLG